MKIIDLLNKIANGELAVGTKLKIKDKIYLYLEEKDYFQREDNEHYVYTIDLNKLNDEVEIIEEQDELIPNHIPNEFIQCLDNQDIKHIAHKVNKIINYLQHKSKED